MTTKYEGPERSEGESCEEHDKAISALETTITNGRWAAGVFITLGCAVLTFFLWVANDNLSSIRSKLDKIETLYLNNQREIDRVKTDMEYLKKWQLEVDEHLKEKRG